MAARRRAARLYRDLSDRLLTDDRMFARLQRFLRASLEARRKVDRNLLRTFAAMNLPSYPELAHLEEQVANLEDHVAQLSDRLHALAARAEEPGRP